MVNDIGALDDASEHQSMKLRVDADVEELEMRTRCYLTIPLINAERWPAVHRHWTEEYSS